MQQDLTPLEPAARTLCQLRGFDPDEMVPQPHPIIVGHITEHPLWTLAAQELLAMTQCLIALKAHAVPAQQEH